MEKKHTSTYKSILQLIKLSNAKSIIAITLAFSIVSIILKITLPVLAFKFAPLITGSINIFSGNNLVIIITAFTISFVLSQVDSSIRQTLIIPASVSIVENLQKSVLSHYYNLSLDHTLSSHTGEISQHFNTALNDGNKILPNLIANIIPTLVELLGIIIILIYLLKLKALLLVVLFIIYIPSEIYCIRNKERNQSKFINSVFDQYGKVIPMLEGYENIHYFNRSEYELQKYNFTSKKVMQALTKSMKSMHLLDNMQTLITIFGIGGIFVYLSFWGNIANKSMFILSAFYLFQLITPLRNLSSAMSNLHEGIIGLSKINTFLKKKSTLREKTNAKPLLVNNDNAVIKFSNVTFYYTDKEGSEKQILDNCSFTIPAGSKTAIVGLSGAGKSTILRLLFRFYDPNTGDIYINNQNIKNITLESLRSAMAVVPQAPLLFHDTIFENIRYANLKANSTLINQSTEVAGLTKFIKKTPRGLLATVGEGGQKISGGEKQRIAIARAILKGSSIYIFDEATSSLDVKTEHQIIKNLDKISRDITTVVITHRLNLVTNADQIIVLDNGKIIEKGNYKNLIKLKGHFYDLMLNYRKNNNMQDINL